MKIKKADKTEYKSVMNFYDQVCDALMNAQYSPGWKKGIYPDPDEVYDAIEKETLYIGLENSEIISCMIVNHEYNVAYKEIKWDDDESDSDVYIIHMLAVSPRLQGRGICGKMIDYVKDLARRHHKKALRLDILAGHAPAYKAYTKCGFVYRGSMEMYYEDTGNACYEIYEYRMKEE